VAEVVEELVEVAGVPAGSLVEVAELVEVRPVLHPVPSEVGFLLEVGFLPVVPSASRCLF